MPKATTADARRLFHEGGLALADIEATGIRIDRQHLRGNIEKTERRIKRMEQQLKKTKVWTVWRKHFKNKANIDSRQQLGLVLFTHMGHKSIKETPTGRPKADAETLGKLNIPFVKRYLKIQQLKKAKTTYLMGIQRETVRGRLHPVFNLHLVESFRGSCDSPNFQNMPIRTPWMGRLIRTCFIARKGFHFVESDFGGLEVCISGCVHKDPRMLEYITDPTTDMHRDMAAECFLLAQDQINKSTRFTAKSSFVFPQFYGAWYLQNAQAIWDCLDKDKLTTVDGMPLREHLRSKGIKRLGVFDPKQGEKPQPHTFVKHLQEVEHRFWYERFSVYREWKDAVWKKYQRTGRFKLITGFGIEGVYNRKEITNYYIQGPAFHCLLWSLIKLNRWLKKKNMRTRIIGQIHDSIVAEVHESELERYLRKVQRILTYDLPRAWPWIIVPLTVETEVSPLGESWFDKKPVIIT